MTEPAIPAEQSETVVPSTADSQIPLGLWPDQDPNLHRVGIYEFEIEASELKKVLRAAVLPNWGAPFLVPEQPTPSWFNPEIVINLNSDED